MKLYDQIFNVVKQFRKVFSPGPVTNADVSGSITAEIFLIVSLILAAILLRHVNVLLAGLVTFILAIVLISNMSMMINVILYVQFMQHSANQKMKLVQQLFPPQLVIIIKIVKNSVIS